LVYVCEEVKRCRSVVGCVKMGDNEEKKVVVNNKWAKNNYNYKTMMIIQ